MQAKSKKTIRTFFKEFKWFWIFCLLFKTGAWLHFTILAPLGERVMPLWIVWIAIWCASILQLILDIPAWYILDKFWYRRLLRITTVIFIAAAMLLLYDLTIGTYVLMLIISSIWRLFFGPWVNAYTLSQAPKDNAGQFISLRDIFESAGIVCSSAMVAYILSVSTSTAGLVISIILFIALICIFLAPKDMVSIHLEKKIESHHYYIKERKRINMFQVIRELNPVSTTMILTNFGSWLFYAIVWFVVPLLLQQDTNNHILWLGLWVFDFAIVVLWWIIWKLTDKYNKKYLILGWLLLFAITWILIGFNFNILFLILGFLATSWDEIVGISLRSWLSHVQKDHTNDGKISWILGMATDLWWAIWPMLAWVLYQLIWPSLTIAIWWAILLIVAMIYYLMLRYYDVHHPIAVVKKPHMWRHKR